MVGHALGLTKSESATAIMGVNNPHYKLKTDPDLDGDDIRGVQVWQGLEGRNYSEIIRKVTADYVRAQLVQPLKWSNFTIRFIFTNSRSNSKTSICRPSQQVKWMEEWGNRLTKALATDLLLRTSDYDIIILFESE